MVLLTLVHIFSAIISFNYRLFAMLESTILTTFNYLASTSYESPFNFSAQFQFIDDSTKQRLVESYYSLDSLLCREIVGKKLSSRLRKDLDEICETLAGQQQQSTTASRQFLDSDRNVVGSRGIRLKSARRQFDNVKRVFKMIEEMAGDYVTNIKNQVWYITQKYCNISFCCICSFLFF